MNEKTGLWMPMYWADYLADTQHLSTWQHGLYLLLIAAYWRRGGPITANPIELARIGKTTKDKLARYGNPVLAMFSCKDGLLCHQRIEKEIKASCLRIARARAGAAAKHAASTANHNHNYTNKDIEVEKKEAFNGLKVINGHSGKWDASNRIAYACAKAVPFLPGRDDGERWALAQAAEDPADPLHHAAVTAMLRATEQAGVGWVSPERRKQ